MTAKISFAVALSLVACAPTRFAESPAIRESGAATRCDAVASYGRTRLLRAEEWRGSSRVLGAGATLALDSDRLLAVVDEMLWMHWLQRSPPDVSIRELMLTRRAAEPQTRVVACTSAEAAGEFLLGPRARFDTIVAPSAVRAITEGWHRHWQDSVMTISDPHVSHADAGSSVDTLVAIEAALGARAPRPIVLLLFASAASFYETFPIRWRDGRFSDYSLSAPMFPGVAFIAPRRASLSPHELVHLVLATARESAKRAADPIPYVAEEALARLIGGSDGVAISQLISARDEADALSMLRRAITGDEEITVPRLNSFDTRGGDVDMLGVVFRLALLRCNRFPFELMSRSNSIRVSAAVARLSRMMRVSPDSVVAWGAREAVATSGVLSRLPRPPKPSDQSLACQ